MGHPLIFIARVLTGTKDCAASSAMPSNGVLCAVQECCARLGVGEANPRDDNVNLENTFLIDLCSGKSELRPRAAILGTVRF